MVGCGKLIQTFQRGQQESLMWHIENVLPVNGIPAISMITFIQTYKKYLSQN
jgi:hypothetical protein